MGKLWSHRDFCRLWTGETVEWITDSISTLGIPTIAIMVFNAGPFEMGVLNALGYLAYPFLGLFAGVWVDRWRRKPVLIWTNIMQVIALASIPIAFLLRILSLYQLFLVTLVMSVTIVFFNMAYTAYLPTLIDREDLVEGNSKLETSASGSAVVSPALAGSLIQILGPALSIAADALGTLIAAIAILSIRKPEPPPVFKLERHFWSELREGLRSVADTPSLRTIAVATSVLNVGNSMFYALFLLFIYDELKISPGLAGIVLSVGAVGFVIGAVAAPTVLKRIGLGDALVLALLINGVGLLVVPTSIYGPAPVLVSAFWLLANIGIPIYNINQVSFRQAIVSDELQGRMNATMRTFGYGAATAGALIGGILGSVYGILAVMIVGAIIALLPVPLIHFGTLGRLNDTRQSRPQALEKKPPKPTPSPLSEQLTKRTMGPEKRGFLAGLKSRLQSLRILPAVPAGRSLMNPNAPPNYAACSRCGGKIMHATRFCEGCGADFGTLVCSCGRELSSSNKFCDHCGRLVE